MSTTMFRATLQRLTPTFSSRSERPFMFDTLKVQFVARAKRGLLAAALIAGAVIPLAAPALPAGAQAAPVGSISFNPSTTNAPTFVAPGQTYTVDVMASNTTSPVLGWQFAFSYNQAVAKVTAINFSDEYLNSYATANSLSAPFHTAGNFTTTPGTVTAYASALTGTGVVGTTTGGRMMQITFQSIANGTTPLTITPGSTGSFFSGSGGTTLNTTLTNGTVNVGPVAASNVVIQTPATVSTTTPPGNAYNVTFVVANTGTAPSTAGTASVAVTNGTPASASVAVAAIAAGANSGTLTAGPFTLGAGQTLSNVTITFGSATATTAYSFASFNSTGTTAVSGNIAGSLTLTAPPAATVPLAIGANKGGGTATDVLNVKSNLSSYNVTIAGQNSGKMTEFDPGTNAYLLPPTGAQLTNAMGVHYASTPDVVLSNTAQPFVSNTRANYNPAGTGDSYTITYDQTVTGNDPAVNPPHTYREVITWAAAGVF
jgi:hypothetical protein